MATSDKTQQLEKIWRFAAAIGAVAVLAAFAVGDTREQLVVVGLLSIATLLACFGVWRNARGLLDQSDTLLDLLAIARSPVLLRAHRDFLRSLRGLSTHGDPVCVDLATERLEAEQRVVADAAEGRFTFTATETWRTVYERLLRSDGVFRYRSVALVRQPGYWQDEPGRRSIRLNLELAREERVLIERICIVADPLWPPHHRLPAEPIESWLLEQRQAGVNLYLVRQSRLDEEPALVSDFGVYGSRAVGRQELDERGRTTRFLLMFDFVEVLAAEGLWDRLMVYATPLENLLDRGE